MSAPEPSLHHRPARLHNDENVPIPQTRFHTLSPEPHPEWAVHGVSDPEMGPAECQGSLKSAHAVHEGNGTVYIDSDGRKRRKQSVPTSESGTEADDESAGILLGLPAPTTRLRKGLKDPTYSAMQSPILTPSYIDDESRRQALEYQLRRYGGGRSPPVTDQENIKLRDKLTRKRRAELLRRVIETMLLGIMGCITLKGRFNSGLYLWTNELFSHALVILVICSLYPFRVLRYNRIRTGQNWRAIMTVRVPAAFDPAPVLYPVLLPIFVALVLFAENSCVLLPSLVLSISSIPYQLIPFYGGIAGYSSVQWMLSTIPISVFEMSASVHLVRSPEMSLLPSKRWDPELLTLLYPLHQALMSTLGYLTTTSLLPAELQLLSVSLMNLMLLGESPQAVIFVALLWTGGLSVCVLCGHVLRREVTLARVPSWRFRRSYQASKNANIMLLAINDSLGGLLSRSRFLGSFSIASKDSDDEPEIAVLDPRRKKRLRKFTLSTDKAEAIMLKQSIWNNATGNNPAANAHGQGSQSQLQRHRRHTLPSSVRSHQAKSSDRLSKDPRRSIIPTIKPSSFLSLTSPQATVLTWIYAIYVYAVVAVTIVFPIRIFVSRWALQGQEPFGWALGYLFGDLAQFRSLTIYCNLSTWISLPPHSIATFPPNQAHRIRYLAFGPANARLLLIAYYLLILILGLTVVFRLRTHVEVDTRRKVFHGMMVVMFLPTTFIDPCFCALALSLVLALFLLLDLFRASQLPPLSKPLMHFLAPYVDGRDHRGPVVVSHIFLLIGCAIPLWLSLAATPRVGEWPWEGWVVDRRDLGMVSGVVCVGMGDAAASLVGRRYGRRRWFWSGGKSLEGSTAFAVAVILGLGLAKLWLRAGGWEGASVDGWGVSAGKMVIAAVGASLTEAVLTGGNDNVVVPVVLWVFVRGLGI